MSHLARGGRQAPGRTSVPVRRRRALADARAGPCRPPPTGFPRRGRQARADISGAMSAANSSPRSGSGLVGLVSSSRRTSCVSACRPAGAPWSENGVRPSPGLWSCCPCLGISISFAQWHYRPKDRHAINLARTIRLHAGSGLRMPLCDVRRRFVTLLGVETMVGGTSSASQFTASHDRRPEAR